MENKRFRKNALDFAILVVIAVVLLGFSMRKQGFHMDEMISFEMANAEFNPWIVPTQPQGRLAKLYYEEIKGDSVGETAGNLWKLVQDVLRNRGKSLVANYKADVYEEPVWIDRQQFQDYLTVKGGDAFNYLSVYFNVKDDNHPPLHFMALHTISSLIQGKAVPLMGCVINMVSVLGCCILFLKLGNRMGMPRVGRTAALLYGLSSGAIATVLLIRMYGMLTFFCVAFFYLHVEKWRKQEFTAHNKWLIAVTVLGFLTQYFFLFYCIGLALVMAVLLIRKKDYRSLWGYIRSMLISAVIGIAIFPFAISDVLSSGRGVEALENLSNGLAGYGERLVGFGSLLLQGMFGLVWLALPLGAMLLLWGIRLMLRKKADGKKGEEGQNDHGSFLWMLTVPVILYFLLAARVSPFLVDRYIMAIYPFLMLLAAIALNRLAGKWKVLWIVPVCVVNVCCYSGEYLYQGYEDQQQIAEEYGELPCVCVYSGYSFYENLPEFTSYSKTLLVTLEELSSRQEKGSVMEQEELVVLVKRGVDSKEVLAVLEQEYGMEAKEVLLSSDSVYGDSVILCQKGSGQ